MEKDRSRRNFIRKASLGLCVAPLAATSKYYPFDFKPGSLKKQPKELSKEKIKLNIRDFGAIGDGKTNDTLAIQQTIDRCWVLGGGEVIVPSGNYLTGSIALRSDTLIRLRQGATIIGTGELNDYPIMQVRWEGKWIQGHMALIYAIDAQNIGIVGSGKIIGNKTLGGRPNDDYPFRHPALIETIGCKNIRFEDFSTEYSMMWCIHPTYCEDVSVKNLIIRSTGGNGDGIDVDSCKRVRIVGCDIATGDDCIAIKSGRGMEGYALLRTTEDVEITKCALADSIFACIGIGSETSGGIRNVRIRDCKFTAARTFAIYIKSRPGRGAFIEDIFAENLEVSGMQGGFLRFNTLGSGLQDQVPVPGLEGIPTTRNFTFRNIRVKDVPVLVDGTSVHPDKPLQGFELSDVSGTCSNGITLANIVGASLRNIGVTGFKGDLLGIYNVQGEGLEGAVKIAPPKIPELILPGEKPYKLG